jgi:hypothetical protein
MWVVNIYIMAVCEKVLTTVWRKPDICKVVSCAHLSCSHRASTVGIHMFSVLRTWCAIYVLDILQTFMVYMEVTIVVTIKDVARLSNTSISTVSRYINGYTVTEENEKRIKDAISTLGYKVNRLGRGLKMNKTMTVGVLFFRYSGCW